ncbi:MAG: hypothetical protein ACREH8_13420 [Opitutaceae bacterium]
MISISVEDPAIVLTPVAPLRPSCDGHEVALLNLQLGVARRADELARYCDSSRWGDRRIWLRAEQEIFERVETIGQNVTVKRLIGDFWR